MSQELGGGAYSWGEKCMYDPATRIHAFRYFACAGFAEPDDIVIDAACGHGEGTQILSKRAKHVYAYDVVEDYISQNKERKLKNVDWILADLETAELEYCDVAITIETIEHLVDPTHFIEELHKKTRKLIVFTIDLTQSLTESERTGQRTFHKNQFSKQEAVDLMRSERWPIMAAFDIGNFLWGAVYNSKYYKI